MIYNIMININDAYAQHCCVMLCSLFENNRHLKFHIHIFSFDLSKNAQELLNSFTEKYGNKICFYILSSLDIEFPNVENHHVSKEAYLRLFAPRYLDDSLDKILYLDVDLLVLKNIEELYSIDLKDKLIAAIEDYPIADRCKRLRIPADYGYFNSGVMLINLTLWRKYKITEQAYSILVRNDIILLQHDQDILNLIAYDKWLRLPFKWNVLDIFFFDYTPYDKKYYKEIAHSLKEDTGIMHFAGPLKPWIAWFPNPFYRHYYKYLSKTPWKGYTPSIKMQWRAYPFPRNLMTILKIDRVLVPLKKRITEYLKKSYVLKKERGI